MIPSDFIPYELTPEQVQDGWAMISPVCMISYCNPSGLRHDPAPGVPAYRAWWENGAVRLEMHCQNGRPISQTTWLKDGRQKDLVPD